LVDSAEVYDFSTDPTRASALSTIIIIHTAIPDIARQTISATVNIGLIALHDAVRAGEDLFTRTAHAGVAAITSLVIVRITEGAPTGDALGVATEAVSVVAASDTRQYTAARYTERSRVAAANITGRIAGFTDIANTLRRRVTAIAIITTPDAGVPTRASRAEGALPTTARVVSRIADLTVVCYALSRWLGTVGVSTTRHTERLLSTQQTEGVSPATACVVLGVTGRATIVETLTEARFATVPIIDTRHTIWAIARVMTDRCVDTAALIVCQVASLARALCALWLLRIKTVYIVATPYTGGAIGSNDTERRLGPTSRVVRDVTEATLSIDTLSSQGVRAIQVL